MLSLLANVVFFCAVVAYAQQPTPPLIAPSYWANGTLWQIAPPGESISFIQYYDFTQQAVRLEALNSTTIIVRYDLGLAFVVSEERCILASPFPFQMLQPDALQDPSVEYKGRETINGKLVDHWFAPLAVMPGFVGDFYFEAKTQEPFASEVKSIDGSYAAKVTVVAFRAQPNPPKLFSIPPDCPKPQQPDHGPNRQQQRSQRPLSLIDLINKYL